MSDNVPAYEVGYAKPPTSGQFAKGKSGNPKGRPKGSKNLASIVLEESRQRVAVKGPRGSYSVTKVEAAVMQLANKAAQGDIRCQRELFPLVRMAEEAGNSMVSPLITHEMDLKVMQSILARVKVRVEAESNQRQPGKEESQ